jgi:hypothetical protein
MFWTGELGKDNVEEIYDEQDDDCTHLEFPKHDGSVLQVKVSARIRSMAPIFRILFSTMTSDCDGWLNHDRYWNTSYDRDDDFVKNVVAITNHPKFGLLSRRSASGSRFFDNLLFVVLPPV